MSSELLERKARPAPGDLPRELIGRSRRAAQLPALRLVEPPRGARRLAWALFAFLLATPFVLAFAPWVQSVSGDGRVIAYAPNDRQQTIDATIDGRVVEWFVQEGSVVKKGDKIAKLTNNDPMYVGRLDAQIANYENSLKAARDKANTYALVVEQYVEYRDQVVRSATQEIENAKAKVEAQKREIDGAKAAMDTDRIQYERMKDLFTDPLGLASRRDYELSLQKAQESTAKYNKALNDLSGFDAQLKAKQADLQAKTSEADTKVGDATGKLREAEISVQTYEKELRTLETKRAEQDLRDVTAPRDGTILRLNSFTQAAQLYVGEPLATMVPKDVPPAVELYVSGNDAPLISAGRHVRLQFEGWPAVQFTGWPSVAVGTFGGTVALVDASDFDGKGRFRILVVPDPNEPAWPSTQWLRQGVKAKGWVLLNQVSLGYEVWRRMNSFPPTVSDQEPGKDAKGGKEKEEKVKVKRPKA